LVYTNLEQDEARDGTLGYTRAIKISLLIFLGNKTGPETEPWGTVEISVTKLWRHPSSLPRSLIIAEFAATLTNLTYKIINPAFLHL
jgi:hypothetical protein